jgi:hypothetical protein
MESERECRAPAPLPRDLWRQPIQAHALAVPFVGLQSTAAARVLQKSLAMLRLDQKCCNLSYCAAALWLCLGSSVLRAEYNAVALGPQWSLHTSDSAVGVQRTEDYTGWLSASYLAAPLLGIGLPLLVSGLDVPSAVGWIIGLSGLTVALALPVIAHYAHDERWRGVRSLLVMPALTLAGMWLGGTIGAAVHSKPRWEDDTAGIVGGIYGAFIGGTIACMGWILFDVFETRTVRSERGVSFSMWPQPGGAMMSLTLRM